MKKDVYGGSRKDFSDMFEPKHDNGFQGNEEESNIMVFIACLTLSLFLSVVYLIATN